MLTYTDLKVGTIFVFKNQPFKVLEYKFVKKQRQKPTVQVKIKNLINGHITGQTFTQNERFEEAEIESRPVQFLFNHRDKYVFCYKNNPSKRFNLSEKQIGSLKNFLKPQTEVKAIYFKEKIISISLPIKMDFKVIEAPIGIKGDTVQRQTKLVKIETGASITVPLFINQGDIIRINTQTGKYVERIKKKKE